MNLSDQIQAWIDADGPYTQGVALYRQCGGVQPPRYYERHLTRLYIPPEIKSRLRRELQKYLNIVPPTTAIHQPEPDREEKETPPKEPAAILALRQRAIPLHKRYSHLKAELYTLSIAEQPSSPAMYEIAREIMSETIPALDGIYDQIREWQRTGEVPDMPRPLLVEQTVQKMKQVQSMRSRISNLRRRIKSDKFTAQEAAEWKKEIEEKELLIAELNAELGIE